MNVKHRKTAGDWQIVSATPLTDEEAASITFRADPTEVVLGGYVEVIDPEGVRVGNVSTAALGRDPFGPNYVTVGLTLL